MVGRKSASLGHTTIHFGGVRSLQSWPFYGITSWSALWVGVYYGLVCTYVPYWCTYYSPTLQRPILQHTRASTHTSAVSNPDASKQQQDPEREQPTAGKQAQIDSDQPEFSGSSATASEPPSSSSSTAPGQPLIAVLLQLKQTAQGPTKKENNLLNAALLQSPHPLHEPSLSQSCCDFPNNPSTSTAAHTNIFIHVYEQLHTWLHGQIAVSKCRKYERVVTNW